MMKKKDSIGIIPKIEGNSSQKEEQKIGETSQV
jgi:hypothetical protein